MFMGNEGIYSQTLEYEPKSDCLVCSAMVPRNIKLAKDSTFGAFMNFLKDEEGSL